MFDFVTGKISCEAFKKQWYADPSIGQWLENLLDLKSELPPEWTKTADSGMLIAIHKYYDGSLLRFIEASEKFDKQYGRNERRLEKIGWYFNVIKVVMVTAYPEIKPTRFYEEEQDFYMTAQGDFIGGPEVDGLIDEILDQFPRSMPKTKRKKEAKARLKEVFHIQGAKYPHWVQEPEWPMGSGSPMAYVGKKTQGELVSFTFQDVDTGEYRVVEQLW